MFRAVLQLLPGNSISAFEGFHTEFEHFQIALPGFLDLVSLFNLEKGRQKALVVDKKQLAQIEMFDVIPTFGEISINEAIDQRGLAAGLRTVEKQDILRLGADLGFKVGQFILPVHKRGFLGEWLRCIHGVTWLFQTSIF